MYDSINIIIPAFNPADSLGMLVSELKEAGFNNIVVINDGSDSSYDFIFNALHSEVTLLSHEVNRGKGEALKTAFEYVLKNTDCKAVVTVDADGQHLPVDVEKCAQEAKRDGYQSLILGTRDFSLEDIPPRSKFGNRITSKVFKRIYDLDISDTQTGLRVIPRDFLYECLKIQSSGYEYETNMLLEAKDKHIFIKEVRISTVYEDNNSTSHFNPIKDSARIYSVFLKYSLSSLTSWLVDICLFSLLIYFFKTADVSFYILLSTVFARLVSLIVNYSLNKNIVFKKEGADFATFLKYLGLCCMVLLCSAFLVWGIYQITQANETIIKMFVDFGLFFVSYRFQKKWIFNN